MLGGFNASTTMSMPTSALMWYSLNLDQVYCNM